MNTPPSVRWTLGIVVALLVLSLAVQSARYSRTHSWESGGPLSLLTAW